MFSGPARRVWISTAVLVGSLVVIENVWGGVGMLIGVAVMVMLLLRTNAAETIARLFYWASGQIGAATEG